MTGNRPPFVSLPPEWVEQDGLRDAYVLAHIRFRCEHGGPGQFACDSGGARYWCASYETIAYEVGLSRDAVKRAVLSLRDKGRLLANKFGASIDQTLGYRPDLPQGGKAPGQNGPDLSPGENALWQGANAPPPGRKRPAPRAKTPDVLPLETVEIKRDCADARTRQPAPVVGKRKPADRLGHAETPDVELPPAAAPAGEPPGVEAPNGRCDDCGCALDANSSCPRCQLRSGGWKRPGGDNGQVAAQ